MEKMYFECVVPYNNEVLVSDRKRVRIATSALLIFAGLFFGVIAFFCATSKNSSVVGAVILGLFAAVSLVVAIYLLSHLKANVKDENKIVTYCFYEKAIQITVKGGKKNKERNLNTCAYRHSGFDQYISTFTEVGDRFKIKIFTGVYNGIPQFAQQVLPKNVFENEEQLNQFIDFMHDKMGKAYKTKM